MSVGFDNVPGNAVASQVFIEQRAKRVGAGGLFIPIRVLVLGQFNTGKTPTVNAPVNWTDPDSVGAVYGRGSELHIMAKSLFKGLGAVPADFCPLTAGTTAATGTLTVTGPATGSGAIALYIGDERVSVGVNTGDAATAIATAIAAAINANVDLPVTASPAAAVVTLTSRYKGLVANQILVALDRNVGDLTSEPTGVAVAIVQMASGAGNTDITTALSTLGNTWYTHIVCPYADATALAALKTYGDIRFDPGVKRPFEAFVPYATDYSTFNTAISALNCQWITALNVEGLYDLQSEMVAAFVGVYAASCQANPERPGKNLTLPAIRGNPAKSWSYAQKNATVLAGGSTFNTLADGSVVFADVVTTYKTNTQGAADDSYRQTCTVIGNMAKSYSLENLFLGTPFDRATIVDDAAVTNKDYAISPKRAKAFLMGLIDWWISQGWSKNRDAIMASIIVEINQSNPSRLDFQFQDSPAAALCVIAIRDNWSFA